MDAEKMLMADAVRVLHACIVTSEDLRITADLIRTFLDGAGDDVTSEEYRGYLSGVIDDIEHTRAFINGVIKDGQEAE